jgi:hypothetical protein
VGWWVRCLQRIFAARCIFPAIRPGLRRVSGLYATGIFTDLVTRVTRAAAFDLSIESARPNLVCLRPGETTA